MGGQMSYIPSWAKALFLDMNAGYNYSQFIDVIDYLDDVYVSAAEKVQAKHNKLNKDQR